MRLKRNLSLEQVRIPAPTSFVTQALYLAKEAGIVTKTEIQKLIISSPSFSRDKSPFLINNFYKQSQNTRETQEESENGSDENKKAEFNMHIEPEAEISRIDKVIASKMDPEALNLFWHNNYWWKVQAEAYGTCKRATSHVILKRGSGTVKVNGEEDIYKRWPIFYNRMDVVEPFYTAGCAGLYDLFIRTKGSGPSGQSRATRLAVARALVNANPSLHCYLKGSTPSFKPCLDALYEDLRQKMPKMPGRTGARSQRQWVKR
ncbi:ribosomal protein S9 [Theileria orientalis strain Shintoku]|uniref:Ribosomal protein S9 n=1 Tax=Theileria orientalis strain Shintoku TaxID=869250 RepID=J4D8L2_THEOR|nr:ribosomal protein S9 [Theileria orientalis strain Shintoku]BAM40835.1 ribosomal protein S9 [Theileria orientalis strain Shintoku]|eukprot:XP_009691136.1 ribosomal protein S9 [Theileria orientalis strain Shintoku]